MTSSNGQSLPSWDLLNCFSMCCSSIQPKYSKPKLKTVIIFVINQTETEPTSKNTNRSALTSIGGARRGEISSEIGFPWKLMVHFVLVIHTRTHTHTQSEGEGTCVCRKIMHFYELQIAVYRKIHFKLLEI